VVVVLVDPASSVSEGGKVNLLILASSLWIGGAETVIRNLALAVDRRRFNVTVCCLKQRGTVGDELVKAGVEVIELPRSGEGVDYFTFRKLLTIVRQRQIDVVHTHTAHGLVDATMCKLYARRLKVVHTFHFGNYPHTKPRIIWMERIFSRFADRLFAVGHVQRKQVQAVHYLPERRIGVIWNGVTPPAPARAGFRETMKTGPRILIGTIATLILQKGLSDLMAVAARLRELGHTNVQFVVCGEGKLRPELEARRAELGVEDLVALPGWVSDAADVALPTFDIFFQPSLWEAMSVVILEAMAAGKPIVATRVGETPHIIEDGRDGLLADPKDIDGMAGALARLLADADLRRKLGEAAQRKVNERFTVPQMTRAYEQAYQEGGR
jgi:glycosyltransferase involved in cell wall biosynthesis